MNMKKTAYALAFGVGMGLTTSGAYAGALASAVLEVTNAFLRNDTTGQALFLSVGSIDSAGNIIGSGLGDLSQASGNNTGDVSASLDSVGGTAEDDFSESILGGGSTDLLQQSQGPSPLAENDFQGLTNPTDPFVAAPNPETIAPVAGNFAISDQFLSGAITDIDLDGNGTVDVVAGVTARTRADVGLLSTDVGTSTTNTGADISLIFEVGAATTVTFIGDFLANLEVWLNPDVIDPSTVQASINWNISIEDLTGGTGKVLDFTPDDVNESISRNVGSRGIRGNYDFSGQLSATSALLSAGELYQISISQKTVADATKTNPAPAPATLALFGLGLLGLGAARRKRKQSA